ncbi:MAG: rhomboid family intramembrane serine protease [Phycisphaerales bacterium]
MLIPLGTDRHSFRSALVTPVLVALCVIAHIVMEGIYALDPELGDRIIELGQVGGDHFHWWGLITSIFLHADWLHLGGNMLFLWVFGAPVEDRYGKLGFLALFFVGGAFSGAVHTSMESVGAIGASGAIAAVTGAFLVLFPRTHVRCFWIFTLSVLAVPAWWFIGLAIAWDFFSQTLRGDAHVAHFAHLGGYTFGFTLSMILLWVRVFPREPYDLFTIFRQAKRRRDLKAAAATTRVTRPAAAQARPTRQNAMTDALAAARAEVSSHVAEGRLDEAVEAYDGLIEKFPNIPGALTLPRNAQYEIANHLVRLERRREAADAYERFLEAYPTDREADLVRLMHGRLLGRYLGEPARAGEQLERVIADVHDPELRALAREELEALRAEEEPA